MPANLNLNIKSRLCLNSFVFFFIFSMIGIYLPKVLDINGFTSEEIGNLRAYSFAIGVIAPFAYSQLSQKIGRKLVLQIGFLLSIFITFPLFYKFNFLVISVLIMLQYFFMLGTYNQLDTLAINTLEDKNDYGIVRASGSIGYVVFTISGGWVADYFGVLNLFWYVVCLQVLSIFIIFFMPSDAHIVNKIQTNDDYTSDQNTEQSDTKFPLNLSFILLMLYAIIETTGQGVFTNFFIIYATKDLGYSNTMTSLIMSTGVGAEIIGLLGAVYVLRIVNLKALFVSIGLLSAFRWYLQGFMGHSLSILLLSQTIHIFTFSFFHTGILKYINDNFKNTKDIGTAIGLYGSVGMGIGSILGAVTAGQTWDLSPQTAYSYDIAFALMGSVIALFIAKPKILVNSENTEIKTYDLDGGVHSDKDTNN